MFLHNMLPYAGKGGYLLCLVDGSLFQGGTINKFNACYCIRFESIGRTCTQLEKRLLNWREEHCLVKMLKCQEFDKRDDKIMNGTFLILTFLLAR